MDLAAEDLAAEVPLEVGKLVVGCWLLVVG